MRVNSVFGQMLLLGKGWQFSSIAASLLLLLLYPLSFRAIAQQPNLETSIPFFPDVSNPNFNVVATETDYTLGAGDRIRIDIFNVPEYSGEFLILVDGTVNLPVIGRLRVEGMTLSEMTQLVSQRYAIYLKRPITSVSLISPRPLRIAIAGEVNSPGSYIVETVEGQKFPSVTQLIQLAGGLTTAAEIRTVQIRRFFQGKEQVLNVDLWQLIQQGNLNQDITLRDRDTIFIPTTDKIDVAQTRQLANANFGIRGNQTINVAVVGEVFRPGSYEIVPEGNESTKPPRLTQALGIAGGITPLADIRRLEVQRFTSSGVQKKLDIDLWQLLEVGDINEDIILQEGDTIVIPTATEIDPTEATSIAAASFSPDAINVNVVGEVTSPGAVQIPPNTPLNQALLAAGGFDKRRARQKSVELIRLHPNGTVSKRDIQIDFAAKINEENNPILHNNDVIVVNRSGLTSFSDGVGNILQPVGRFFSLFNFFRIFD